MPEVWVERAGVTKLLVVPELDEEAAKQVASKAAETMGRELGKGAGTAAGTEMGQSLEATLMQRFTGLTTLTPATLVSSILGGLGISYSISELFKDIKDVYTDLIKAQGETAIHAVWAGIDVAAEAQAEGIIKLTALTPQLSMGEPNPYYRKSAEEVNELISSLVEAGFKFEMVDGKFTEVGQEAADTTFTILAMANAWQISAKEAEELWVPIQRHLHLTHEEAMDFLGVVDVVGRESKLSLDVAAKQVLQLANYFEQAGYSAQNVGKSAAELRLILPTVPIEDLQTMAKKLAPSSVQEQLKLAALIGLPVSTGGLEQLQNMETGVVFQRTMDSINRMAGGNEIARRMLIEKYLGTTGYTAEQIEKLTPEQFRRATAAVEEAQPMVVRMLQPTTWWGREIISAQERAKIEMQQYGLTGQPLVRGMGIPGPAYIQPPVPKEYIPSIAPSLMHPVTINVEANVHFETKEEEEAGQKVVDTIKDGLDKAVREMNLKVGGSGAD
jgi:hypothetical protein